MFAFGIQGVAKILGFLTLFFSAVTALEAWNVRRLSARKSKSE
jgi:hypothetical protein